MPKTHPYSALLRQVQKPSRYLGTELNSVHKDPAAVDVRLCLIFPDLYDLGLGNLGLHILYAILNKLPWCWTERSYAPAPDMDELLRAEGMPLFALESKEPLAVFDALGFTLQSELTYTNILNILELSEIPLRAASRGEEHPLVFSGGPSVFNPEPLAPFMDFMVIGDGEEVVTEVAECLRASRSRSRREKLLALSQLEGVYVPSLYPMELTPEGRILPAVGGPMIRKRTTPSLDLAAFPKDYIVPFTQQVHDRVSLEVLRGCTQGCRFCQAGMTTRPVRERSLETLDTLLQETLERTGYEEVSLVSLSTCDYSRVQQLVDQTATEAQSRRVSVSLPSLRLDSFSVGLADRVAGERRTGLTFAPEAASPRLRAVINKWIPDEDLLTMATQAYERGWSHVKLYFMIGLPTERDDDVEAIADLTLRTLKAGREVNRSVRVHTGVSTFVPKPFTPFQWARQITPEETQRRQDILHERFGRNGGIRFGRHEPEETFLEGLISRGDRRTADLIERAYRHGARLDAWREHLQFSAWEKAIEELQFDVEDALRERGLEERLPWDHIDIHIPKAWFQQDWQSATELKHAPDCRHSHCHRCGVIDVKRDLCAHMLRNAIDGSKEEGRWTPRKADVSEQLATTAPLGARIQSSGPPPRPEEPEPVQRLRFRIGRQGEARFLSHLESMNAWIRALRRARAPLSYSQGFHAHAKVQFASAAPVGESSLGDLMDITLHQRVDPETFLAQLRSRRPPGFLVLAVAEVPLRSASLMSLTRGYAYSFFTPADHSTLRARAEQLLGEEELLVERRVKKRGRRRRGPSTRWINIRPMIEQLEVLEGSDSQTARVEVQLKVVEGRCARWAELIRFLELDPLHTRILKRETLLDGESVVPSIDPTLMSWGSAEGHGGWA